MYVVYWIEPVAPASSLTDLGAPSARSFGGDRMKDALDFMESLRSRQRLGEPVGFVTMCSENPQSVGPAGAADPSPDYHWTKRRRR
ncbi:hypothetical protein [Lacisediminimonas sp.]|uniref:hypothetical protein n=1 Tax=Lacisediminimonas sp. TaxID=3060582 RepID=UPI00272777CD|nr:hypothetical protein [Lacisediminimonas sp.]MDO8298381.1 hypothetical protein [Lacisediminimonas sp.]